MIGLGRFGMSLAIDLVQRGHEVLGIDDDAAHAAMAADHLTHIVHADATDEKVLRELDLQEFDSVMLAIGEDVESSVFSALMLKEVGVKRIWAKARDRRHKRMLELIGVDRVVLPEHEMGEHVASLLTSDTLLDFFELTDEHSIAEIAVGPGFVGRSLREIDLRGRWSCNVVALYRAELLETTPDPDAALLADDVLLLVGRNQQVDSVERASAAPR